VCNPFPTTNCVFSAGATTRRGPCGRVTLPGEDHLADSFLLADRMLVAAGFEHYEVSNFARGPGKRSRHNQKYWRRTPTLGLGPAAHSFDGRTRWRNVADPGEYTSRLACGILPGEDREELTPEQARLETIGLGLRTSDGLERSALDPRPETNSVIASLVSQGLLLQEEGRLRPTERGMLLADALARALC
jgi:coproporphyrinogen III oxidase-like Fe-S oxidoreductase